MPWTLDHIKKLKEQGKIVDYKIVGESELKEKKKHKYSAEATEVNGIMFPSKKEANRYKELLLYLKAGEIGLLERQVEYELNPGGTHSLKYFADFRYFDITTGQTVVEDAKGFRTREYKKKKKLMKKVYGIVIVEV